MAVAITRTDFSARELRLAASKAKDSSAARRMLGKRRLGPIDFEDFRRVMCLPHRLWTQMET
jgi:hypothetical protein